MTDTSTHTPATSPTGSRPTLSVLRRGGRDVSATISRLSSVAQAHALRLAYDVGRIVCDDLFSGDLAAFRRRSTAPWMRDLAHHPELPISAVALSRSCSIFELMERLGVEPDDSPLTVSHYRAVLVLGTSAPGLQGELLAQAAEEEWTAEDLAERVRDLRPIRRRGRRPHHPARKAVAAVRRAVDRKIRSLDATGDTLEDLDPDMVPELVEDLEDAERALAAFRARLASANGGDGDPG